MALISVAIIVTVTALGGGIKTTFQNVKNAIAGA
jgi:Flp pilus assembly pilin Flp